MSRTRKLALATVLVAMAAGAGAWLVTRGAAGPPEAEPPVLRLKQDPAPSDGANGTTLRVATLNAAHGRANGFHQAVQGGRRIRANLDAIADLLRRESPDVVALQEVDGPSVWSGRLDHVRHIAERGGYGWSAHGHHVRAPGIAYGTAVLARASLEAPRSITFKPSPPTFSKGFLVATVRPQGRPDLAIDVVSVHLDFARPSVRRRQVDTLIKRLRDRGRSLIIMGDFNCGWRQTNSPMRDLVAALDLKTWQPEEEFVTFPTTNRRIDWILISSDLSFAGHRVLQDVVSEHLGVVADIALPPPATVVSD